MPDKPKILTRRLAAASQLFKVEAAELEFSNGEKRTYEYLAGAKGAAVIIVPLLNAQTVLLVEEYGIGLERYELGLPKGKVDAGETHLDAADRELKEEVGYGARELIPIKCLSQSPSYMQHQTQIVIARGLYPASLEGDEPEPLIVHECAFDDIDSVVSRQNVTEARTIAALYLAKAWIENEGPDNR